MFTRIQLPVGEVKTLAWDGDELLDLMTGRVFSLDGQTQHLGIRYAYRFDRLLVGPGGWKVLYEQFGTKALLLRGLELVRELDRSYYFADVTPFPIAFATRGDRVLLIHAPDEYNRLEVEDVVSAERFGPRPDASPDFFQARLAVSPDGRWLVSAGWFWHPVDGLGLYDLDAILDSPGRLDDRENVHNDLGYFGGEDMEHGGASVAFCDATHLVFMARDPFAAQPHSRIGLIDVAEQRVVAWTKTTADVGTLLPLDRERVVVFSDHPRVVRLSDGSVEHSLDDLVVSEPDGCLPLARRGEVPLALDVPHRRFAVATPGGITIVTAA